MQLWLRSRHSITLLICATLFFTVLLLRYTAFRTVLSGWDIQLLYTLQHNRPKSLDRFFSFFTDITTYISAALLLGITVRAIIKKSAALARKALQFFVAVGIAAILSNTIKHLIDRERPFITYPFIEKLSTGGSPSFPSGHTTEVFAVATILALLFPDRLFVILVFIWALIVAYTRMALGVHYPSDILGAALLGSTTSLATKAVFDHFTAHKLR